MAGPGAALEDTRARVEVPRAGRKLRSPRRRHQRARQHPAERLSLLVLGLLQSVRMRLLVAGERLPGHADLGQPLHVRHPVPAGHEQPQREPVLRRQRHTVQVVGEQRATGIVEREPALEALLLPGLHAAVEAREDDVRPARPGLVEERPERDAAPAARADRLLQPGLRDDVRLEQRAPVARALHRRDELAGLARAQLVQRQRERPLDVAAELEPPPIRIDERDVVVGEQVVEPDRSDVVAKRLERHSVIPRSELQLFQADLHT